MARKRKATPEPATPKLYSLTGVQAEWLRKARAGGADGCYLPITSSGWGELVDAGAATLREVAQTGGTRSATDNGPCRWTDHYLMPTERGLELLAHHDGTEMYPQPDETDAYGPDEGTP